MEKKDKKSMNLPWVKLVKLIVLLAVLAGAFWWFSWIPRQQAAYPLQVRAACHAQANQTVAQQAQSLTEEQRAEFNDIAVYELQYTLCRRANGVGE